MHERVVLSAGRPGMCPQEGAMSRQPGARPHRHSLVLVLTIIVWSQLINWLGYRVPAVQRLISPPPLLLVQEGRVPFRNLVRRLKWQPCSPSPGGLGRLPILI